MKQAKQLEKEARELNDSTPKLAKVKYEEAAEVYKEFISKFNSSELLNKAYKNLGEIYYNPLKNYDSAMKYYRTGADLFKGTRAGKEFLFMNAFIEDEKVNNKDSAKILYKEFLEIYPSELDSNDKMSKSAKVSLYMIENKLSVEDIIITIEKKKTELGENEFYSEDSTIILIRCFVVIADTGRNYFKLREKMFNLSNELKISIDTMGRGYIKKKNLIGLPENDDDPDYAGSYFPRRYFSDNLSLEYINYYTRKDFDYENKNNQMTIAIVAGVIAKENEANKLLQKIKKIESRAFILKGVIYRGCMH
jgi:tetratricopeptide (TPR) repeat protein